MVCQIHMLSPVPRIRSRWPSWTVSKANWWMFRIGRISRGRRYPTISSNKWRTSFFLNVTDLGPVKHKNWKISWKIISHRHLFGNNVGNTQISKVYKEWADGWLFFSYISKFCVLLALEQLRLEKRGATFNWRYDPNIVTYSRALELVTVF